MVVRMASAEADGGPSGQERSVPGGERRGRARLRVLGPINGAAPGAHGTSRIDLGGPRQRRLLAALAVDTGRLVPADRLAERVWGERLPEDPRASLRTLVARLRGVLGAGAIIRDGAGYRLDAAAEGAPGAVTLDSLTFVDLVAEADEPGSGLLGRLDQLEAALALWSGPAYDEVAHEEWARAEAERLDELRATSTEHRFEAMLAAGKHRDALPQLAGAVESFPWRDGLVGLQMLALYRSGRQAEAARAFQAHRARLASDLGLEPGHELLELDRRIVAGDPALHLSPEATATTGRALRGYRLGEQLGEGALAVVFRGTQPSVGRDVAVKVIRAELANRPDFVRRFEAEAQLVANLEHPHVVPLYDYWREPDRAYLVLRYLRGGTLEATIKASVNAGRGLPLSQVRLLVMQVGSALAAAHRAGVVHRDVRPANVFLDEEGNNYLGDFGIALGGVDLIDPGPVLTAYALAYAAPEQLRRERLGPQTDVHGLGITVYEALTGQLPFPDAVDHADLVQRQLTQPIPAVRHERHDVPAVIDEVLATATAKQPRERF
jgi:DNA-binding SARP family transcriptional activator